VKALLVTGTGTGVGKTTVAAALAALAAASGSTVVVVKPAQTGESDGAGGDVADILRRAPAARGVVLAPNPHPLSPAAAARRSGRPPLSRTACVDAVGAAAGEADLVLVEGAGGLLVHYDDNAFTMADLAVDLDLPVLLVTTPGLGTLNSTALTLEAMTARGLLLHGLVIGAWPARPDLAERSNVADLEAIAGQPLAGALAADAGVLDDVAFLAAARRGLSERYGGEFDATAFRQAAFA
jgi:dethiobiotin synthetase